MSARAGAFLSGETLRPEPAQLVTVVRSVGPADERATDERAPRDDARFESYEVIDEIGRGGTAVVFRARQVKLGREVAVKRNLAGRSLTRAKFLAEARITGLLEHPGIVPVYDLLVAEGGEIALAMKLVRGTSWKELLHPRDPAAARSFDVHLGILLGVSNAVAFAHSKGISHNDLKPANVMVGEFGEVLVVDWGLALDLRDTAEDDAVAPHRSVLRAPAGTPAYWAPELARGAGREIGLWTDVYLLGGILYEIATGHAPHRGGSLLTAIMEAVESDPPPFTPGLPAGLEAICRKAMAPAPTDRYPTVAAFQDAVRGFLAHRESATLAAVAAATLERAVTAASALDAGAGAGAQRNRVYADFAEAASGFRQALVLRADSPAALAGERRASTALAELALRAGDFGLAEVQLERLDAADPGTLALGARIREAFAERARAKRQARSTRRALAAAVGTIVVGLSAGLVALRAAHRRTEESAALATARLADIRRLADVKRLGDYTAEADLLWPARREKLPAMEAWLTRARALAAHLDGHRAYLAEVRRHAQRAGSAYAFTSPEDQWEHDTLAGLVAGLERFATSAIPGMERRMELARTLRARTLEAPHEAWERAVASIASRAECPAYAGLHLAPQLGLVPLGRDAASGLWEFVHVESGEAPARGPDGRLALTEQSGVVLVLLPGGTFSMGTRVPDEAHPRGSPNVDPAAKKPEGPVHPVTLVPFFLGKYELTQGQWLRATGENPSAYGAGKEIGGRRHTLLHPVEQIGWKEASQTLARLGLRLPTEAQWEYGARAGTTTIYFTGGAKESLQGAANLADRYCRDNGGPGSWPFETWLDDGYVVHAPVGSFRANAFGLHDTAGNVWEFVEDRYGGYELPVSPGDGERQAPADAPRVFRGGGFRSNAVHARSADRYNLYAPDYRGFDVGVRAARGVDL